MRAKVSSGKSKPWAHPTQNPCQIIQRSEFQFLHKMQNWSRQNIESMKRSTSLSIYYIRIRTGTGYLIIILVCYNTYTDMLLYSYETHDYELNPQTYRTYKTIVSFTLIKSIGCSHGRRHTSRRGPHIGLVPYLWAYYSFSVFTGHRFIITQFCGCILPSHW